MSRDSALAGLAEARGYLARMIANLDEALDLFIDPSEDKRKKERAEIFDVLVDDAGNFSRVIELVQDMKYKDVEPEDEDGEEANDDAAAAEAG